MTVTCKQLPDADPICNEQELRFIDTYTTKLYAEVSSLCIGIHIQTIFLQCYSYKLIRGISNGKVECCQFKNHYLSDYLLSTGKDLEIEPTEKFLSSIKLENLLRPNGNWTLTVSSSLPVKNKRQLKMINPSMTDEPIVGGSADLLPESFSPNEFNIGKGENYDDWVQEYVKKTNFSGKLTGDSQWKLLKEALN